jgi:adenylate kinase family enzyme
VPSSYLIKLLKSAILCHEGTNRFLIDGFPRGNENLDVWEKEGMNSLIEVSTILYFECSNEEMTKRLVN